MTEQNKRLAKGPNGVERPWTANERYMLFARGFRDGASTKGMDPAASGLGAYDRGYTEGRAATNAAVTAYAKEIGYEPTILRVAEERPGAVIHYTGHINILHKGTRTMINHPTRGGTPVCGTTSPNASWGLSRGDVTCRRCLRLIAMHDVTAAASPSNTKEEGP